MEAIKYNVVVVAERIADAPIPDSIKLQALDDLLRMLKDKEYAKRVEFVKQTFSPLSHMMIWSKTDLGFQFWYKIMLIIH